MPLLFIKFQLFIQGVADLPQTQSDNASGEESFQAAKRLRTGES